MKQNSKSNIIAGLLLFLASTGFFFGITIAEVLHPSDYIVRNNSISVLGGTRLQSSLFTASSTAAAVFNIAMIVGGIMMFVAAFFVYSSFKKRLVSVSLGFLGLALLGLGVCPVNIRPWHYFFSILIFLSGQLFTINLYRITTPPLRYIFLIFGLTSSCFTFLMKIFIPIFGGGGQERLALYPVIFCTTGFGAYLLGRGKAFDDSLQHTQKARNTHEVAITILYLLLSVILLELIFLSAIRG